MKLLLICSLFFAAAPAFAKPGHVLLIRHGEKPDDGDDLSSKGYDRAKALPKLFDHPELKSAGDPVALYAQKSTDANPSKRAEETLKPLAEQLKLTIKTNFKIDEAKALVKEIMGDSHYDGKLVVIAWEHNALEDIAAEFGVDPKPKYPKDEFDRAWLLTFESGETVKFEDFAQKLLPGDAKN
ncbi:MAG: histidine phosphatase family protein [Bdellovibrionota bacterium]